MKKGLLLLIIIFGFSQFLTAQTKEIKGKVTSAADKSPIPGVTVFLKGTNSGTITDADGNYVIKAPNASKVLVFSFVGMNKQEIAIGDRSTINVELASDNVAIDEVVVVGYGSTRAVGTVVSSVSKVSADKIKEKPVANILDAMQGRVSGLQVYTSSGEPSAISTIRLHGAGSIGGSTAPLFVVDGVPVDANTTMSLNPNDYESITVLKDASATSIYGARAANGVLFITTKRGKASTAATISIRGQYGTSELTTRKAFNNMMNSQQLTDFWVETGYKTRAQVDAILAQYPNDTRWDRFYYKDYALTYQGDVAIQGGSEKTTYYIDGAYFYQDGLAYRSEFDRYTLRTNINSKANEWLSIGLNLSLSYDKGQTNQYGTNSTNRGLAMLRQPFYTPYDANGNEYPDLIPGINAYNPKYLADKMPYENRNATLLGTGFVQITPFKGLTLKSQVGMEFIDNTQPSYRLPSYKGSLNNGSITEYFRRRIQRTITNTAEYKYDLNERNKFVVLAGHEYIDYYQFNFSGVSTKQTDDRLILLGNGTDGKDVSSGKYEYAYLSFFGRIEYSLDKKYFLDISMRNDASSIFGKNKRNAKFGAFGFMWDAKKESFLQSVDFLSSLNLKASIGTSGNSDFTTRDAAQYYRPLALIGTTQYGGNTGWWINSPGNPDLGWEKQLKTTIGVKFGLFKDRYRFNIELYHRKTTDMAVSVPYAWTSGFSSIMANVGGLTNKGIDVAIDFDLLKRNKLIISPFITFSYNKEKITELFQGRDYWIVPNTGVCWAVGKPISFFYPMFAGVDPADGAPMWYVPNSDITQTETTTTTKTFNTAALQQNTGIKRYAPINGGFGFNASWNGINLDVSFAYSLGKYLINNDRYFFENPNAFPGYNQSLAVLDYWKQPGDVTKYPAYKYQFMQFDDRLIENASFLRLKTLAISYNLPSTWLNKVKVFKNIRITATGRNLLTFTKYLGPDPEIDSNLSLGANPNTKQYSIGAELTF